MLVCALKDDLFDCGCFDLVSLCIVVCNMYTIYELCMSIYNGLIVCEQLVYMIVDRCCRCCRSCRHCCRCFLLLFLHIPTL